MRSRALFFTLALAMTACGGEIGGTADVAGFMDPGQSSEIHLLPDAVILETGAADFAVSDAIVGTFDQGYDAEYGSPPPTLSPMELRNEFKAITNQPPTDVGGKGCGPDKEVCAPGQACLVDEKTGEESCVFVAECSGDGAVTIEEILKNLIFQEPFYIKIEAKVLLGPEACTVQVCPADDPCCNDCFAPLYVGSELFSVLLLGDGLAIGCQGSECNFDQMCKPLLPDQMYWIWGRVDILGDEPQFTVDGFCIAF